MATAKELLALAEKEIGTKEMPKNSNNVKYNTVYYNRVINSADYSWCAVFLWWLFAQAEVPQLYFGGKKTAYCPALLSHYRSKGQTVADDYQPGDIVFFNFNGKKNAVHVGICENFDGTYVTTIDGNTGVGNDANGGAVMRRKRGKQYIVGVARPQYEEVEIVTQEQFDTMMDTYLANRGKEGASSWAGGLIQQATALGITADGERPKGLLTREEGIAMALAAYRAAEKQ